jgi:hypothetical protein
MSIANPLLRDHVTSAAFVLSLGKTHVAALVRLDLQLAAEVKLNSAMIPRGSEHAWLHRNDVTGMNGLMARGLVAHVYEQNKHKYVVKPGDDSWYKVGAVDMDRMPVGQCWNITRAGRLVADLLKEAGLYQEYAGPLLPLIEAERERRSAA